MKNVTTTPVYVKFRHFSKCSTGYRMYSESDGIYCVEYSYMDDLSDDEDDTNDYNDYIEEVNDINDLSDDERIALERDYRLVYDDLTYEGEDDIV
jgi:hypothetical protein